MEFESLEVAKAVSQSSELIGLQVELCLKGEISKEELQLRVVAVQEKVVGAFASQRKKLRERINDMHSMLATKGDVLRAMNAFNRYMERVRNVSQFLGLDARKKLDSFADMWAKEIEKPTGEAPDTDKVLDRIQELANKFNGGKKGL